MACRNGKCSRRNKRGGGGNSFGSSLGGAATGATIGGSIGGPVGAGIGTAVGALGGYLAGRKSGRGGGGGSGGAGNSFSGTEGGVMQSSLLSPQQQGFQNQLIGQAQSQLQNFNDPNARYAGFEPIEQRARSNFYTNTVPTLAERFTSQFGPGAKNGSAFRGEIAKAGVGLDEGLAALRAQYGMQNQSQQQNLLSLLINGGLGSRSFENSYMQSQPGFGENALSSILQAAPALAGAYFANRASSSGDGGLGNAAQSAFNGEHKKVWDNWIASNSGGRNYGQLF